MAQAHDEECQEVLKQIASELKHYIASLDGCAKILNIHASEPKLVTWVGELVVGNQKGLVRLQQGILDLIDEDYVP